MPKRRLPPIPREAAVSAKSLRESRETIVLRALYYDDVDTLQRRLCLRGSGPGGSVDLPTRDGEPMRVSLLHAASLFNSHKATRLLLSLGADPKAPFMAQGTPFCAFCTAYNRSDFPFLQQCFESGVSPAPCQCHPKLATMLVGCIYFCAPDKVVEGMAQLLRAGESATPADATLALALESGDPDDVRRCRDTNAGAFSDVVYNLPEEQRVPAGRLLLRAGASVNARLADYLEYLVSSGPAKHAYGAGTAALLARMRAGAGPSRLTLLAAAVFRRDEGLREALRRSESLDGRLPAHLADLVALRGSDVVDLAL